MDPIMDEDIWQFDVPMNYIFTTKIFQAFVNIDHYFVEIFLLNTSLFF